jgi:hypothetical protein
MAPADPADRGGPQNAKICRAPFGTACSSYNRRQNSGSLSRDLRMTAIIIIVLHLRLSSLWWEGVGGDLTSEVRTTDCNFLCLKIWIGKPLTIEADGENHSHVTILLYRCNIHTTTSNFTSASTKVFFDGAHVWRLREFLVSLAN